MEKKYAGEAIGAGIAAQQMGGFGYSNRTDNRIAALEKKLCELEQRERCETTPVDGPGPVHPDTDRAKAFERALQDISKIAAGALIKAAY